MKTLPLLAVILLFVVDANAAADSLLQVLDHTIALRETYTKQKEEQIETLKRQRASLRSSTHSPTELYDINRAIIGQYESLVCDSAEVYINHNIALARETGNEEWLTDSRLQLAFVYALSGLFVQADEVLGSFDDARLEGAQRARWCWTSIRYLENYSKYTADPRLAEVYNARIAQLRDTLLAIFPVGSPEYLNEYAYKLQAEGDYPGAIEIRQSIFADQRPDSHGQAMAAASLAKIHRTTGERELENHYLKIAAIADTRFAAKENEALLTLAMNLFAEGDITRAYTYTNAALADANFYNSRFRNSIIARVQPVVERNYLDRIESQRRRLIYGVVLSSLLGVGLAVALTVVFRQIRIVKKARVRLREMNRELIAANSCREATYIHKLDDFRKNVNAKIRSGQVDKLYDPSDARFEKEMAEMFSNFDRAFLQLYPDFVREFNAMQGREARHVKKTDRLNTELRIFALMKLGVTDAVQIARFLNCSVQTIYNYRSKAKLSTKSTSDV